MIRLIRFAKCVITSSLLDLGENLPTKLGLLVKVVVVAEASSRGENFNVAEEADHLSICEPRSKTSATFYKLKGFLANIATEMKEEAHPQKFSASPRKNDWD